MSQAKVDKYKNEKANRKKTNARNKVKRVIARIVAAAAVVALVAHYVRDVGVGRSSRLIPTR